MLGAMAAVFQVEVFAADDAQAFAIGFADWADWKLQDRAFAHEGLKINVRIFGKEKLRFCHGLCVECVQLSHFPDEGMVILAEASYTLKRGLG